MFKKYLKYIGLEDTFSTILNIKKQSNNQRIVKEFYEPSTELRVAERYLTYLKEIHKYQRERRTTIENKNSQLVGQASMAISIIALFIPLLIGNLNSVILWLKVILLLFFLIIILHYILSISHAVKTLAVDNYEYPSRSTKSVTKTDRKETEIDFINSEIEDLIYIINQTTSNDNIKGSNLIYGARCFKIGNIGLGIMTILIVISTFSLKKETPEIKIQNLNELKLEIPDTLKTNILDLHLNDTLVIKFDSLDNKIYQEKY